MGIARLTTYLLLILGMAACGPANSPEGRRSSGSVSLPSSPGGSLGSFDNNSDSSDDSGHLDNSGGSDVSDRPDVSDGPGISENSDVSDGSEGSNVSDNSGSDVQTNPPSSSTPPVSSSPPPAATPSIESDLAKSYVQTLYRTVLLRNGTAAEVDFWANTYLSGAMGCVSLTRTFLVSTEAQAIQNTLASVSFVPYLYQAAFGRPGDTAGVNFWLQQLNTGIVTRNQMVETFAASPEVRTRCGTFVLTP